MTLDHAETMRSRDAAKRSRAEVKAAWRKAAPYVKASAISVAFVMVILVADARAYNNAQLEMESEIERRATVKVSAILADKRILKIVCAR